MRGFSVSVGIIDNFTKDDKNKTIRNKYEIDFIATKYNEKIYIQSCWSMLDKDIEQREKRALNLIDNTFKKIIVTNDNIVEPYHDVKGNYIINIIDFLLMWDW